MASVKVLRNDEWSGEETQLLLVWNYVTQSRIFQPDFGSANEHSGPRVGTCSTPNGCRGDDGGGEMCEKCGQGQDDSSAEEDRTRLGMQRKVTQKTTESCIRGGPFEARLPMLFQ
ncbi:hypothetical protein JTE90_019115 [Oedothorax gibbosus]|uniref:Uncharacterized protein n=1 Tax=Oedothorax gibbosus TaxID=931172 RepID=A0AAV6V9E6_9ARAC|nr:hypothetical protein JTE90_019115 [Oedothorax gibbosus]